MVNHPEILWAQRSSDYDAKRNVIFLSIAVPELDPTYELKIEPSRISFKGHSSPPAGTATAAKVEPKWFEFDLELFGEVEETKRTLNGKNLALVLQKKTLDEEYWPRLTKEKVKLNYVKTDFSKWVDQDEQDAVEEEEEEAPQGPPGAGGMMAGMGGGAGGAGGMDLEAMMKQMQASGMGGMGGAPGDFGDDDGEEAEEEDEDDDGPPPLEEA